MDEILKLLQSLNSRFDSIETRLDSVENGLNAKLADVDKRLQTVDTRLNDVDARLQGIELTQQQVAQAVFETRDKVDGLDKRLDVHRQKFVRLEEDIKILGDKH